MPARDQDQDLDSSVSSSESDAFICIKFPQSVDQTRFDNLATALSAMLVAYVSCSSVTFCSSVMSHAASNLDPLLTMVDLITIDISSAITVVTGFACCHVYRTSDTEASMYRQLLVFFVADLWMATVLACFIGSLWRLALQSFHFVDLLLTLGEGLTSFRQFEYSQHPDAAHTMNPFAWLVMCMFIPAVLLPNTYRATEWLHVTFHDLGVYVIIVLCSSGVLLFSVFASLHDDTNILYSSASSVGYRMLEFNMGVNLYYLMYVCEVGTIMVIDVLARLKLVVMTLFACAWWSEFGVRMRANHNETCVRLYYFNTCLVDHPGVLIRGSILGVGIVSWYYTDRDVQPSLIEPLWMLLNCMSTVLMCFPLFVCVKGGLQLSFAPDMVNQNSALLSLLMPISVFCIVYVYNLRIKPLFVQDLQNIFFDCHGWVLFRRPSARRDSSEPGRGSENPAAAPQTSCPSTAL